MSIAVKRLPLRLRSEERREDALKAEALPLFRTEQGVGVALWL